MNTSNTTRSTNRIDRFHWFLMLALSALLLLSACGGGDGGNDIIGSDPAGSDAQRVTGLWDLTSSSDQTAGRTTVVYYEAVTSAANSNLRATIYQREANSSCYDREAPGDWVRVGDGTFERSGTQVRIVPEGGAVRITFVAGGETALLQSAGNLSGLPVCNATGGGSDAAAVAGLWDLTDEDDIAVGRTLYIDFQPSSNMANADLVGQRYVRQAGSGCFEDGGSVTVSYVGNGQFRVGGIVSEFSIVRGNLRLTDPENASSFLSYPPAPVGLSELTICSATGSDAAAAAGLWDTLAPDATVYLNLEPASSASDADLVGTGYELNVSRRCFVRLRAETYRYLGEQRFNFGGKVLVLEPAGRGLRLTFDDTGETDILPSAGLLSDLSICR